MELSPFLMAVVGECRPLVSVEIAVADGVSICAVNQVIKPYNAGILDSSKHQRSFSVDPDDEFRAEGSAEAKFRVDMGKYFTSEYGKFGSIINFDCERARFYIPDECANLFILNLLRPYAEIRNVFDRWIGKIDPNALIVISGTQTNQPESDGRAQLFEELSHEYPAFQLTHSAGLGIVDLGREAQNSPLSELLLAPEEVKAAVRQHFAVVGQRMLQATGHATA